jgi:hypothetical protein
MRFPVFMPSANPAIDTPVVRKSRSYCEGLISSGEAQVLLDSKGRMCGIHLSPPNSATPDLEDDDSYLHSRDTKPTITFRECDLNAQYDAKSKENSSGAVRAHRKIKVWPVIGDTKAIRVGVRV